MRRKWRRWVPAIVFWTLFLASLGLGKRYPWLHTRLIQSDTVWYATWMLFLVVLAVCAIVQVFRHADQTGGFVGYRGVPRWVVTLLGDDVEPPGKTAIASKPDSNS
jgi:hypothetical protein